jgi:hypothetical protein
MVARYEPDEDVPPPAEVEPPLGRPDERAVSRSIDERDERDERAASSSIGPIGAPRRTGRLPVVVVDRLEDLDGPEASVFRADAWAVHLEPGKNG